MILNIKRILTIAGSDPSGGAGIQADIKTITCMGAYAMSAITAITIQNTNGVSDIQAVATNIISKQIDAVINDIGVDAVKTGMLVNREIVEVVAEKLITKDIKTIVIDPVMQAKDGTALLCNEGIDALRECLIPIATVITPNIPEAIMLTGIEIKNIKTMKIAAEKLYKLGCKNVVIKGGHSTGTRAIDVLFDGDKFYEFSVIKIHTKNTHGTGCTFSSALSVALALGKNINQAVNDAKEFVNIAIEHSLCLGTGHGPTNHLAPLLNSVFKSMNDEANKAKD